MKLLFSIFLMLLLSLSSTAQIEYPRYSIDSLGQKIVELTIQQAMKIDNNLELLELFEKMNSQIANYDSICIKTLNDKGKVISAQKIEIATLKNSLKNKEDQIISLQNEVAGYITRVGLLEQEVKNRQFVIDEKNLQILGLKTKMIFGGIGGGALIVGLVALILSVK